MARCSTALLPSSRIWPRRRWWRPAPPVTSWWSPPSWSSTSIRAWPASNCRHWPRCARASPTSSASVSPTRSGPRPGAGPAGSRTPERSREHAGLRSPHPEVVAQDSGTALEVAAVERQENPAGVRYPAAAVVRRVRTAPTRADGRRVPPARRTVRASSRGVRYRCGLRCAHAGRAQPGPAVTCVAEQHLQHSPAGHASGPNSARLSSGPDCPAATATTWRPPAPSACSESSAGATSQRSVRSRPGRPARSTRRSTRAHQRTTSHPTGRQPSGSARRRADHASTSTCAPRSRSPFHSTSFSTRCLPAARDAGCSRRTVRSCAR